MAQHRPQKPGLSPEFLRRLRFFVPASIVLWGLIIFALRSLYQLCCVAGS